ncbi:MAG: DNA repair protein RadA, partial [Chloroflexi bacterium]|nr:DNA repair protein RadA [Chloroflexota bacterium]
MAKSRTRFVCQNCGATQAKWMGRCPECEEWNTLVETVMESAAGSTFSVSMSRAPSVPIPLTEIPANARPRIPVPMEELSRVLGGGIVPGAVMLIGGDPGIGKSTLLLQLAAVLAEHNKILYVSGEESLQQIKLRAERLHFANPNLYILAETNLDQILSHIEQLNPTLAVVDSIQSVYSEALTSSAGSISQVRDCASALLRLAKARDISIFLVGHVTKTGSIAGPRVLEHIVDTVLYLEGERFHTYRLLRSVKNRFGSTNEIGVFEMRDSGLVEVSNPSQVFLEERLGHATGSAVAVTMEGTRPLLVEVQALVSQGSPERPRRTCNGVDLNRVLLLTAVLTKRVGLRLSDQDI